MPSPNEVEARRLFAQGLAALNEGRYADALPLLLQARERMEVPAIL